MAKNDEKLSKLSRSSKNLNCFDFHDSGAGHRVSRVHQRHLSAQLIMHSVGDIFRVHDSLYSNHKINVKSSRIRLHCKEYIVQRKLICIHELEMIYNLFNRHCYPQLSCSTPSAWHLYPDGSPPQSLWSPQPLWQQEPRRLPPCRHASLRCASSTPLSRPGARIIKRWWTDDNYIEVMVIMAMR